jgi:hypothetical protein
MNLMPLHIKKRSAWQYANSSTGGIGVWFIAGEGGRIYVNDPAGHQKSLTFGTLGVGVSIGFNGKNRFVPIGAHSLTPPSYANGGAIYVLDGCTGTELALSDFRGVCALVEVSAGAIAGASGTAMLLGMSPAFLTFLIGENLLVGYGGGALPYAGLRMLRTAKALLVMSGVSIGPQIGGGINDGGGYLR